MESAPVSPWLSLPGSSWRAFLWRPASGCMRWLTPTSTQVCSVQPGAMPTALRWWGAPLGSVPVRFPGFAALGHKLYVAGGCGQDGCFSTSLHEYDACSGQWAQLPSMSWPLDPHGFLVCSRRLYAMGGCMEAAGKLDSAETFDLEQKQWTPAARLPFPLSYFASAALHNKLYLIGGKKHVAGALAPYRGLAPLSLCSLGCLLHSLCASPISFPSEQLQRGSLLLSPGHAPATVDALASFFTRGPSSFLDNFQESKVLEHSAESQNLLLRELSEASTRQRAK
uniref:Kelch domain containing 8B n=1 Tax=Gopherus agassizii TaxID=38772 RepID=A0A452HJN5_9SAUR